MGYLFPFLHSRARGNRAPGKWPRDGLRTVDRLRSQSGCNGAGGGRSEVGRSFDQLGQVQAPQPPHGAFPLAVTEQSRCGC